MILCSECKCIWHIDCDNISKEQLVMLRTLSLHQQYKCHRCIKNKKKCWRDKLSSHFIVGCLAVLRSLAELHVAQNYKQQQYPIIDPIGLLSSQNNGKTTVPEYLKKKYFLRDCSVAIQNIEVATEQTEPEEKGDASALCQIKQCTCTETLTLLEVKRKVISSSYYSLTQFRHDLDLAIRGSGWNDVFHLVDNIFCKQFSWCAIMSKSSYAASCTTQQLPPPPCLQCHTSQTQVIEEVETEEEQNVGRRDAVYDCRNCVLCLNNGDKSDVEGGRLLYCESNTCIHVGCALWSVGVHETLDGALLGVAATVRRARLSRCILCKLRGNKNNYFYYL